MPRTDENIDARRIYSQRPGNVTSVIDLITTPNSGSDPSHQNEETIETARVLSSSSTPSTQITIDVVPENRPRVREIRFVGVIRKRAKLYMISGIDLDSNEEGLHDFLVDIGITFRTAKFLYTNRTDCQVAQIVVDEDQREAVEDPKTWPDGITCRRWLKRSEYIARRRARLAHNDSD